MFEYYPQFIKERSETRRKELLHEAEEERRAKQLTQPRRVSFVKQVRTVVSKMLSL